MKQISIRDKQLTIKISSIESCHCVLCGGPSKEIGQHGKSKKMQCMKCNYKFTN